MTKSTIWKQSTAILLFMIIFGSFANAQITSGGNYTIEKSVTANGGASGNSASVGGNYTIEGTIGQSAAGTKQQNSGFTFQPGFWNAAPLSTTAANVMVSGRILTANGRGIRNVIISLMGVGGETRTVVSGAFGYYRFTDVAAGETYIFTARSKRFTFSQPTQVRSIIEDTNDIVFTANN